MREVTYFAMELLTYLLVVFEVEESKKKSKS